MDEFKNKYQFFLFRLQCALLPMVETYVNDMDEEEIMATACQIISEYMDKNYLPKMKEITLSTYEPNFDKLNKIPTPWLKTN